MNTLFGSKRTHQKSNSSKQSSATNSPQSKMQELDQNAEFHTPSSTIEFQSNDNERSQEMGKFITQLSNLDKLTTTILPEVDSPALKVALQQLASVSKTCGILLNRAITIEMSKAMKSLMEEERREHSLVVSGLPESTDTSAIARIKQDTTKVHEILDVLDIPALPMTLYRMGRPNGRGPRPLKVEMPTRHSRDKALRNRSKLKNVNELKSVFIRPSMSLEERNAHKSLIEERVKKNAALGENERDTNPFVLYAGNLMRKAEVAEWRKKQ